MSKRGADFNNATVRSLLGLLEPHEFFISADHFASWRRHLAWSKHDGAELRTYMTQRFASSMVFMSLLLSAELGVLFNSSKITTEMRVSMMHQNHSDVKFWIGLFVFLSVFLTLFTLIATFTAWGMVSAVSNTNAHCMLRSSIGQYVTQLPSRLLVSSVYCFLIWMSLWLLILLPGIWSTILLAAMATLFVHLITSFSAFGRLMMLSGAMGSERIFDEEFEQALLPSGLHTAMLLKATESQRRRLTVTAQYSTRKLPTPQRNSSANNSNTKNPRGGGKKETPRHHRRIDTLDSDEKYMIEKTANAFSGRSLQVDPDVIAQAPPVPSIVSPTEVAEENEDDQGKNSDSSTASSVDSIKRASYKTDYFDGSAASPLPPQRPTLQKTPARRRFGGLTKSIAKSIAFKKEWENDNFARSMYNRPPAAKLEADDDDCNDVLKQSLGSQGDRLPRASVLNTCNHSWNSISRIRVSLSDLNEHEEEVREEIRSSSKQQPLRGMEPFTHFIRRLKDGRNNEDCLNDRGSLVKVNGGSLVMVKEGEASDIGERLERGDEVVRTAHEAGEAQHLLGDSSPQRRAYAASGQEIRQAYPLSPIESIGDLEELHRDSPAPPSPDGKKKLSQLPW